MNRVGYGLRGRIPPGPGHPDRGFVLVGVLVVVMLVSMIALSLLFRQRAEETAAAAADGSDRAWEAALAGVREGMAVARQLAAGIELDGFDAPVLEARVVFEDGDESWRFTLYSRGPDELTPVRFGLSDEAGKLNLNTAGPTAVAKLPGLQPLLTEALLDFIDADNEVRPEGAEQEYYDALPRPYRILNGPLVTVDQLLLVRGFTPALVYGEDANLNFRLDPGEDDGPEGFPPDDGDGVLNAGLRGLVTVSSYEPNRNRAGELRVNVNAPGEVFSTNGLPPAFVEFVNALRTAGETVVDIGDVLEASYPLRNAEGATVDVPTGVGREELDVVLDRFTATADLELKGLINVNTASKEVLQTVPGIDEALAETIVSTRSGLPASRRRTVAWLFSEGVVEAPKFREIAPHLTARGFQYGFHVVGYGAASGRYKVLEVIVDVAPSAGRLLYLRDITRMGLPFPLVPDADLLQPGGADGARSADARVGNSPGGRTHSVRSTFGL